MRVFWTDILARPFPRLVMMIKEPRLGHVKTRLGRDIGAVDATWWFRHQTRQIFRHLSDRRWQIILAVSPDNAALTRSFPGSLARIPQGRGDLGDRMARMLHSVPAGPTLIMGADIPGVTRRHIVRGFHALSRRDFTFGPAPDGGFWSVGAARRRALPPALFSGARWSSESALADSLATLNGQTHELIDTLADVDTGPDLARWKNSARPKVRPVIGRQP